MAEYNKYKSSKNGPKDHRYFYLYSKMADDWKELHGIELTTQHKQQMMRTYRLGFARLRNGHPCAQSYLIGIRERVGDTGDDSDSDDAVKLW